MRSAGTPAASARRISPSETTSTPAPSRPRVRDHRDVGVGLDRVADQRVEAGEGLLQHPVVPLQRGGGVDVDRRAHLVGKARQAHVLRVEDTTAVARNGSSIAVGDQRIRDPV